MVARFLLSGFVLVAIICLLTSQSMADVNDGSAMMVAQPVKRDALCQKRTILQTINGWFGAAHYDDAARPGLPRTATTMSFDRPRTPAMPTPPIVKVRGGHNDSTIVGWIDHHIFGMGSIDVSQRAGTPRVAAGMLQDTDATN